MIKKQIKNLFSIFIKKHIILVGLSSLLIVLKIFVSIQISTAGSQLAKLENDSRNLKTENKKLESMLVESTSLIQLSEKASQLGYVKASDFVYLTKGDAFALR